MGRLAGDSSYYTFVLQDYKGRYHKDSTIRLPSVSTVVKAVLAAPGLVPWAYAATRDAISGLSAVLYEDMDIAGAEVMDTFMDPDMLEEYLKENGLRPDDISKDAMARGTREHKHLEDLAKLQLKDFADAENKAWSMTEKADGWERAIADWWLNSAIEVEASEMTLFDPAHGFAGTADLVWYDDGMLTMTDLKTRKEGARAYASDMIQVDGYMTAWEYMYPDKPLSGGGSVLVARADGTYVHQKVTVPRGTFLKVKELYDILEGSK
jgi:hypothetical protein